VKRLVKLPHHGTFHGFYLTLGRWVDPKQARDIGRYRMWYIGMLRAWYCPPERRTRYV
jgi:hypothetical protein